MRRIDYPLMYMFIRYRDIIYASIIGYMYELEFNTPRHGNIYLITTPSA